MFDPIGSSPLSTLLRCLLEDFQRSISSLCQKTGAEELTRPGGLVEQVLAASIAHPSFSPSLPLPLSIFFFFPFTFHDFTFFTFHCLTKPALKIQVLALAQALEALPLARDAVSQSCTFLSAQCDDPRVMALLASSYEQKLESTSKLAMLRTMEEGDHLQEGSGAGAKALPSSSGPPRSYKPLWRRHVSAMEALLAAIDAKMAQYSTEAVQAEVHAAGGESVHTHRTPPSSSRSLPDVRLGEWQGGMVAEDRGSALTACIKEVQEGYSRGLVQVVRRLSEEIVILLGPPPCR